jgi:hypothetical protein
MQRLAGIAVELRSSGDRLLFACCLVSVVLGLLVGFRF